MMNLPSDEPTTLYEAVKLQKLTFQYQQLIDKRLTGDPYWPVDTRVIVETIAENMRISMISRLTTQSLEKRSISYPADWIEAIKQRWFPVWLLKRYPVRYYVETIEAHAVYPKIATEGCSGVIYMKTKPQIQFNGQKMEQLRK